jgi:retron-type reverse transcriptase
MRKSSRKSAKVSSRERRYVDCRNGLGIEAICWMLVRKERKRKVHSLIDKVWNWKNLNEAWKKVKKNRGAAGIDKVTIDEFERNLEQNLNEIQRLLRQDKYEPMPVNRIYIPKSDGKQRPLGIPIIRDRVVQQALKNVIEPIFEAFLKADIMEQGMGLRENVIGTPQGGVISPLLANIYLHYFDERMAELGYEVVRYADDFLVLCEDEEEAKEAITHVKEILDELELTLHPEKTKIKNFSEGVDFLGFTVYIGHKVPRKEAVKKYKDAVRRVTRRNLPINLEMVIVKLNPIIVREAFLIKLFKKVFGATISR